MFLHHLFKIQRCGWGDKLAELKSWAFLGGGRAMPSTKSLTMKRIPQMEGCLSAEEPMTNIFACSQHGSIIEGDFNSSLPEGRDRGQGEK